MTRFITGGARYDVSAQMRAEMARILKESKEPRKIIYIVPDQFEYETEKAVYRVLDGMGLAARSLEVNIRTFSSISEEIINTLHEKKRPADDIVKNIIMHRVIKEHKNALSAFGCAAEKQGFCKGMVRTVTMLKTAGITAEDLSEERLLSAPSEGRYDLNRFSGVLDKLRDVRLLYTAYNARLGERWLDKLDFTSRAAELIGRTGVDIFDNALVFVDCFNDFTGSQEKFLYSVITYADDVSIGFVTEDDPRREELFYTVNAGLSRLFDCAKAAAAENNAPPPVITRADGRDRYPEGSPIRVIAENMFAACSPSDGSVRDKSAPNGSAPELIAAKDIYEELEYTAAKIRELTDERGLRYKDIAVLCTEPQKYADCVRGVFSGYDIPVFIDIPESILHLPLVNLIMALLKVCDSFSTQNVLSYVKTGFLEKQTDKGRSGLTKKDIDAFESYIYEWALDTEALKRPFTYNDRNTELAELIRAAAVEPVLKLQSSLTGKTGAEMTELLTDFIINKIGIQRAISACCKTPDGSTDSSLVRLYQRLWDTLVRIFDALHSGLAGDNITLPDYIRLFRDICADTTLAKPPQYIDAVLVGDIDRTRAGEIKAAFIVGALYDAFPSPTTAEGVFSSFETELIRENIAHIDDVHKKEYSLKSAKEQYCLSLYRAYRAVTLPTEFLCVSCPETDITGRLTERSELFAKIAALFERLNVKRAGSFGAGFYARTVSSAKRLCAEGVRAPDKVHSSLRAALNASGESEFTEKLITLLDARTNGTKHHISSEVSKLLFSDTISATKAETLSLCGFLYFCRHGLNIRERTQRTFNSSERGNAVHYVLQKVMERYSDDMEGFFSLDRAALSGLVRFYLDEFKEKELAGDFSGDKRVKFLFDNIALAATDALFVMQSEFALRYYRPVLFELDLSEGGSAHTLSEQRFINAAPLTLDIAGRKVYITGKIDRVDAFEKDGNTYIRVTDYKTGSRAFSAFNARHGVNVQMPLYLFALCDANKDGVLPGGVSYMPAKFKSAVKDRLSQFELLTRSYRQSGMYLLDNATKEELSVYANGVIDKAKSEVESGGTALEIKDILPDAENILTKEQFDEFRKECLDTVRSNIERVFMGDVSAAPLRYKERVSGADGRLTTEKRCPCDYCGFSDVCGAADRHVDIPDPPPPHSAKELFADESGKKEEK